MKNKRFQKRSVDIHHVSKDYTINCKENGKATKIKTNGGIKSCEIMQETLGTKENFQSG